MHQLATIAKRPACWHCDCRSSQHLLNHSNAMPSFLKNPWVILALGVVIGTAYGSKIPVLGTAAKKLPGAGL